MTRKIHFSKRSIIIAGAMIFLVAFLGYWFAPQKIISNPDLVVVAHVYYLDYEHEVKVEPHELATILSKYYCQRRVEIIGPFETKRVSYYIDLIYLNHGPIHIYLGDLNFMSRGNRYVDYNILEASKLQAEIEALIQRSSVSP